MSKLSLEYLYRDRSRHGQVRHYVRKGGRKIRIRAPEGSVQFMEQYHAALAALFGTEPEPSRDGTLRWLCQRYFVSPEFKMRALSTQEEKMKILRECCDEKHPTNGRPFGDCPADKFTSKMVLELMDRRPDHPSAANKRAIHLSALYAWAIRRQMVTNNPARGVSLIDYETEGYHTWTEEEIRQFARYHKLGSRPYLAMALMLFTGARRSDVYLLGRQHLKGGVLEFRPQKTRRKRDNVITFEAPPQLLSIIEATPGVGDMAFIITEKGTPFASGKSFGHTFGKWCEAAGLPHCSCHGLRKALASILAEEGATERQLMAIGGWESTAVVGAYVRKASKKKLASSALAKLKPGLLGEQEE